MYSVRWTSSTQVLLNGSPGQHISHRRGLRQGDPLSPMLFILVMDVLGFLITKAENEGLLRPLATRTLHHRFSIYADDVVIFIQPTVRDISTVLDILHILGRLPSCEPISRKAMYTQLDARNKT